MSEKSISASGFLARRLRVGRFCLVSGMFKICSAFTRTCFPDRDDPDDFFDIDYQRCSPC